MKKNFVYALLSAIALAGSVGFISCSSSEDIAEDNPGYNKETGEVPVNFVFNVSTGSTSTTRMTGANTQATIPNSSAFRGIGNAVLMAYKLDGDGKHVATPSSADAVFDMGTIINTGSLDPNGDGSSAPKSRRVIELALPSGTNTMMFWGKAVKNQDNYQQGKIDWTINKDISQNAFSLVKIVPEDDSSNPVEHGQTAFAQYQNVIATILTKIIQVETEQTILSTTKKISWSDYVKINISGEGDNRTISTIERAANDPWSGEALCTLGGILADAFISMNTIYQDELRAGSGPDVARLVGDLYEVVKTVGDATPTSDDEIAAKTVGENIVTQIGKYFTNDGAQWNTSTSSALTVVLQNSGLDATAYSLVKEDLNLFPKNFNLPLGSVIMNIGLDANFDTNHKLAYYYQGTIPTYAMGGGTGGAITAFDPKNYMYPPELCYFGNSSIRITDDEHITSDYPDGADKWYQNGSWEAKKTGTDSKAWTADGHVLSSTRSVAMKDNINYGTALLKTTVKFGTNILKDNNAAIQLARKGSREADNEINVASSGLFELTGILVGGQEQTVGWNYLAKAGSSSTFNCMVYDRDIPSTAIPVYSAELQASTPCYTLVWDNWAEANKDGKQRDVHIALEFKNNSGIDFWGEKNLIRKGGTFYITGKLDPDAGLSTDDRSAGITWPSTDYSATTAAVPYPYALPPYEAGGTTIQQRRVFIQDYMTTANFVLNENSLKHALVTVPDLRSTQISLGLSVDLNWSTGMSFDNVILGGEGN